MVQQTGLKVPFEVANVRKCICPSCPVQSKSACVAGLKEKLNVALVKNPLQHNDIPRLYCGTGKATCTDLDLKQSCICGGCPVFSQYKLATGRPVEYYCKDGAAG
jgi:hypothetical protein